MDLWVWAHLLETTVAVLSLGALCDEEGFDYTWKSKTIPTLTKGDLTIACYPTNNVPLIYTVKGNLSPVISEEDAIIQEILDEVEPPPTADEEWIEARKSRKGKSRP